MFLGTGHKVAVIVRVTHIRQRKYTPLPVSSSLRDKKRPKSKKSAAYQAGKTSVMRRLGTTFIIIYFSSAGFICVRAPSLAFLPAYFCLPCASFVLEKTSKQKKQEQQQCTPTFIITRRAPKTSPACFSLFKFLGQLFFFFYIRLLYFASYVAPIICRCNEK